MLVIFCCGIIFGAYPDPDYITNDCGNDVCLEGQKIGKCLPRPRGALTFF